MTSQSEVSSLSKTSLASADQAVPGFLFVQQADSRPLCDPRLSSLDITHWTDVEIGNDLAAKCISLYLETDHPLLGHFHPDQFVEQLISGEQQHCSALLVNALLYWACVC